MEHFVKKLLAITGIMIVAGLALLPVASYAAESSQNIDVEVVVERVLRLDAASGGDTINLTANQVSKGNISAKVYSTMPYTISLSAAQPNLVYSDPDLSSDSIPASSNVAVGTDAWGVKKSGESNYTAISTDPTVFYTGTAATPAAGTTTNFEVGISLGSNLAAGTYSTAVTVLAAFSD